MRDPRFVAMEKALDSPFLRRALIRLLVGAWYAGIMAVLAVAAGILDLSEYVGR